MYIILMLIWSNLNLFWECNWSIIRQLDFIYNFFLVNNECWAIALKVACRPISSGIVGEWGNLDRGLVGGGGWGRGQISHLNCVIVVCWTGCSSKSLHSSNLNKGLSDCNRCHREVSLPPNWLFRIRLRYHLNPTISHGSFQSFGSFFNCRSIEF